MADDFAILVSVSGEVRVDLAVGNLAHLTLNDAGTPLEPLHRAPWADDPSVPVDHLPPVEQRLSGDFLCAPAGEPAAANAPRHGPAANARWRHLTRAYNDWVQHPAMVMELTETVQGAGIVKEIALGIGAPVLYQSHRVVGGTGVLPVATHPMIGMAPGDRIAFSPKMLALTQDRPPVDGRHLLSYPATSGNPTAFPGLDGPVDLTRFPVAPGTDDFVQLIEAPGRQFGWTAVTRAEDVVFVVKDTATLPLTQLWFSNGGRRDPPWNGHRRGFLGIADARVPTGWASVPDGLALAEGVTHVLNHAIGAIRRPTGWTTVTGIELRDGELTLTGDDDSRVAIPFSENFF